MAFVSPIPCPFNYGSVLETQAPDGDPMDAVVLGARVARGEVIRATAWGWAEFTDRGVSDPKLICTVSGQPPGPTALRGIARFFRLYARCKRLLYAAGGSRQPTRFEGLRP